MYYYTIGYVKEEDIRVRQSIMTLDKIKQKDSMDSPLLSIITINYNNSTGLDKTMASVLTQITEYPENFEYIIIDGSSTDGSVDVIKKYLDNPDYKKLISYWCSEKDNGIYNAMNKGIKKSHGKYCLFLNSGDWLFANTTLQSCFLELSCKTDGDIYYFDLYDQDEKIVTQYPEELDINFFIRTTINHQNSLIKRELFNSLGYYNESYKISSDWAFFLLASYNNFHFIHLKTHFCFFDRNGISATYDYSQERIDTIQNVFGTLAPSIIELYKYQHSVYGNIIDLWGSSTLLVFILKTYRFFVRRFFKCKKK